MPQTSMYKHRHRLHQLAEISGAEQQTAAYISAVLQAYNPQILWTNVGGYGVVAIFKGRDEGRHILLRAELDALPIAASSSLPYHSENARVSHRCGHDGHMAILLGVGAWLYENPLSRGQVIYCFNRLKKQGQGHAWSFKTPVLNN